MKSENHRPVTRSELREELKRCAMKKDLDAALRDYPTKKDLVAALLGYATKKDLEAYAKQETVNGIALRLVRVEARLDEMNERMATKDDMNRIIDHLVVVTEQTWNRLTMHDERLRALEERCPAVS